MLRAKEIYDHITQSQKNVKPFSATAGWLTISKGRTAWEMLTWQARQFKKFLLSIIYEKGHVKEQVSNSHETSYFRRTLVN